MSITLINTVTVGAGGAASVDFTSIPGTYTDLQLVISCRGTNTGGIIASYIKFNGSTTTYSRRTLFGNASTAYSTNDSSGFVGYINAAGATSNTFTNANIYIPNYAGTTNKSFSTEFVAEYNDATNQYLLMNGNLWATASAITSISFTPSADNWAQNTVVSLYGILKGSSGGVTIS